MIDLDRQELALRHTLAPPFEPATEEKNWALFAHEGALLCIYSFNPYIVLEINFDTGVPKIVVQTPPVQYEWLGAGGRFISNSTNPIIWDDDHYIMFVHDYIDPDWPEQRDRLYMQYAVLISTTSLLPTSIVPTPLLIGGRERGRYAGVHYTTSLVNRDSALRTRRAPHRDVRRFPTDPGWGVGKSRRTSRRNVSSDRGKRFSLVRFFDSRLRRSPFGPASPFASTACSQ
jgi:hypothetical protein